MTENEHTMKIGDVAKLLDVHPATVRVWKKARGLPCCHVGKYLRFSRREVLGWLAQHRAKNSQTSGADVTPPSAT
jgi:excisionase family DNA binding protein